jgi:hypothetical protein
MSLVSGPGGKSEANVLDMNKSSRKSLRSRLSMKAEQSSLRIFISRTGVSILAAPVGGQGYFILMKAIIC